MQYLKRELKIDLTKAGQFMEIFKNKGLQLLYDSIDNECCPFDILDQSTKFQWRALLQLWLYVVHETFSYE